MTASLNPFSDLSKLGQNQTEGSETVSECASGALSSGDQKMMRDYLTGDPYLAFGVQAKLVPTTATQDSHEEIRERLKSVSWAQTTG